MKDLPVGLYQFLSQTALNDSQTIAIDPTIAFGRPVVVRRGVSTAILAADYDLAPAAVELHL